MTLSVRRSVAALAVGAALVLAGCGGPPGPTGPPSSTGRSSARPRCRRPWPRSTRWTPQLLQAKLTPTGTLTALVQAPVVLTYLDGLGVKVSDTVARQDASAARRRRPGRLHPRDHQARHRPSPRPRVDGKLTEADAAALTEQLKALKIDVNPRYGTFNPQTASIELTTPGWVTPAKRGAVTDGRLALVVTSPRVAPGLLSHGAWEAVAGATVRLARSLDEPLAEAVDEFGFAVEEVGDVAPAGAGPAPRRPRRHRVGRLARLVRR